MNTKGNYLIHYKEQEDKASAIVVRYTHEGIHRDNILHKHGLILTTGEWVNVGNNSYPEECIWITKEYFEEMIERERMV